MRTDTLTLSDLIYLSNGYRSVTFTTAESSQSKQYKQALDTRDCGDIFGCYKQCVNVTTAVMTEALKIYCETFHSIHDHIFCYCCGLDALCTVMGIHRMIIHEFSLSIQGRCAVF